MRYLPHTEEDVQRMLSAIGTDRVEELFEAIPAALKLDRPLDLPPALSEPELIRHLDELACDNQASFGTSFLGAGAYSHNLPAAVDALVSRSEFTTAYTPYQPEISQGTLQAIFEYQTLVARLLGMEVANASMYDGASATAEAVLMGLRIRRSLKHVALSAALHPDTRKTIATYLASVDLDIVELPVGADGRLDLARSADSLDGNTALVLQSPNFYGCIEDLPAVHKLVGERGPLLIAYVAEPYSLGLLAPPGRFGADIVTGEGQAFGSSVSFGGPYLGLFATRKQHMRQMPGRLAGRTRDEQGNTGYVLTLATREQHIRRARATSNICTNEGLCALAAAIHLCLLGPRGLAAAARASRANAEYLKARIAGLDGFELPYPAPTFNEFVVRTPGEPAADLVERLAGQGLLAGVPLQRFDPARGRDLLICATEMHRKADLDRLVAALAGEER